jgi:4a-hydroxytetrahydrobiopterin dehydratase
LRERASLDASGIVPPMSVPAGWAETGDALERELQFESFPAAIEFVRRLAELAERENHHPDIAISYRRVTLRWTTHTAGGVTDRDRVLAARTNELF